MIRRPPVSGWYLMSPADLEIELRAWRLPDSEVEPSDAEALTVEDALSYRDLGNLPDELGRTLRLVLVLDRVEPGLIERERARFEPDFHDAPTWRREGSKPVNVVPLVSPTATSSRPPDSWWDDPVMAAFEAEWSSTGAVAGLVIPREWRGFVFKTIASLRASGREVTVDSVVGSVARWLGTDDVERLRSALAEANP